MREMIKMVVVLTVLAAMSGGLLAAIKTGTQEKIDQQVLEFVQGPAIRKIMDGVTNDPIADRFSLEINGEEKDFFVGKYDGNPKVVAFETSAAGFGGDLGVIVGINVETGKFHGISVTTHSETPGIGSRIETDDDFKSQFAGLEVTSEPKVKKNGGDITAMSGATITSGAVAQAVRKAGKMFSQNKSQIQDKVHAFSS